MVNVTGTMDKSTENGLIEVSKLKLTLHKCRVATYKVVKRVLGFLFALLGLIIASPVMLIVAIAIKLDSKGPVLFKQERTGYKVRNRIVIYRGENTNKFLDDYIIHYININKFLLDTHKYI